MFFPSTVPSIVPDCRGPLNVPVIVPPSCFNVIVCDVFPAAPDTSTVQVPATFAGASAANDATATTSNSTNEANCTKVRGEEIARMEVLTVLEFLESLVAHAG